MSDQPADRPRSDQSVERPTVPVLTFLGAAGTVTGSRFLLDTPDARVLVDCGLFQGQKVLRLRNWDPFPVPPGSIDAVVVTHGHIDHVGYVPALVRDGFAGPVHCTDGTRDLARIVLPDSGHLQEEEARYANRKGYSKHHPALPLYTEEDAHRALPQFTPHPFHTEVEVAPGVHVTFRPAGHIIGSATLRVRLAGPPERVVVFSGDLGRPQHPVLRPPAPVGQADVLVLESTYGDRLHDDESAIDRFAKAISRTAGRGGQILIPAFAVDRTEVILFHLRRLAEAGRIPKLPIYVDSPMALSALSVYRRAIRDDADDVKPDLDHDGDPFDAGDVTEVRLVEESMKLADLTMPAIIVSASGMASGGRVVHHLARMAPEHRNTIVLAGFQAPGTRGRLLADGIRRLKMLGRYVPVRADVVDIGSFSVHADQSELLDWLGGADSPPEVVYLVHGEPGAAGALAERIEESGDSVVVVAAQDERVRLD
jgi:metallo-beta-lactamase family protein